MYHSGESQNQEAKQKEIMKLIALFILMTITFWMSWYAYQQDPATQKRQVITEVIENFKPIAPALQTAYQQQQKLTPATYQFTSDNPDLYYQYKMTVTEQVIGVRFSEDSDIFAGESFIFEPWIKDWQEKQQKDFRWRCINGSILTKYRPKPCRTGKGLLLTDNQESEKLTLPTSEMTQSSTEN